MLKKIYVTILAGLLCFQLSACGNSVMEFETEGNINPLSKEAASSRQEEAEVITEGEVPSEQRLQEEEAGEKISREIPVIFSVHVCGAVKNPGVYQVESGTRLYRLIEMAGGFLQEADENYLNLAREAEDGMQIRVPTKEEVLAYGSFGTQAEMVSESGEGKVDINKADEALLCTLPGIGESRAKSIIKYREENGYFQTPEDIMKISGIKEAAYEKIKDYIIISK
ncbi:MAG: helix-hairpin-helix domain-containing protein [Lachnospiraceae bacterium]|nr:helix-hairpin-helix domain-containing protein [Lachnospiraceae bacterium]